MKWLKGRTDGRHCELRAVNPSWTWIPLLSNIGDEYIRRSCEMIDCIVVALSCFSCSVLLSV